jgi:hypothetical protein
MLLKIIELLALRDLKLPSLISESASDFIVVYGRKVVAMKINATRASKKVTMYLRRISNIQPDCIALYPG